MIDTGFGSAGFYFNGSGLQWNETDGGFDGWLGELLFLFFFASVFGLAWMAGRLSDQIAKLMVWLRVCVACDWWHGVPQLFWKYFAYDYALLSSCAEVNLVAVNV